MARVYTMEAAPLAGTGTTAIPVRVAGGASKAYAGLLGFSDWFGGILAAPRFAAAFGFDENGPTGGTSSTTTTIEIGSSVPGRISTFAGYYWRDTRVTIKSADDEVEPMVWRTEIVGNVTDWASANGNLSLTIADLGTELSRPVVSATFAGTGGIEGGAEAAGRVKRRNLGRVFNIELRVLDKVNNIYEAGDPAIRAQNFTEVRDKGAAGTAGATVAWQGSVASTFAALQAATPPQGGYTPAPSIQAVKWWTQPVGPLTADLTGENQPAYVEKAADLAAKLVGETTTITIANLAATNTARPYQCGISIDSTSTTIANVLDLLLLPLFVQWTLGLDGVMTFREISFANPVETIAASLIEREAVFKPLGTRTVGYRRNYRVQTDGEIAAIDLPLVGSLSNDAAQVAATSDGTVSSYAGAGGRFTVQYGSQDVTGTSAFSVFSATGMTIAIDGQGNYTPSAMTADTATATLRATYGGRIVDKVYSLAKQKAGAPGVGTPGSPGANGQYQVTVYRRSATQPATPTGTGIPTGWSSGVPDGTDQLWSTTSTQQVVSGAVTLVVAWSTPAKPAVNGAPGAPGANGQYQVTVYRRAASQPATPTGTGIPAGWTSAITEGDLQLWASTSTQQVVDGAVVLVVAWSTPAKAAANGAAGQNGLSVSVSPGGISLNLDANGSIKPGQLPLVFTTYVSAGGPDLITESCTFTAAGTNCTVSVSNTAGSRGRVTLNSVNSFPASFTVTATAPDGRVQSAGAGTGSAKDGDKGEPGDSFPSNTRTPTGSGYYAPSEVNVYQMPRITVPAGKRLVVDVTVKYRPLNSGTQYRQHTLGSQVYYANSDSNFTAFSVMGTAVGGSSQWLNQDNSYNESSVTVPTVSVTNNTGAAKDYQINVNLQSSAVQPANDPAKWDATITQSVSS